MTRCTEFNWLNFTGHVAGTKCFKDATSSCVNNTCFVAATCHCDKSLRHGPSCARKLMPCLLFFSTISKCFFCQVDRNVLETTTSTKEFLQCNYHYQGHTNKVNQSQDRRKNLDSNVFFLQPIKCQEQKNKISTCSPTVKTDQYKFCNW